MEVVEYTLKERIAHIALNRPDKLNALNSQMVDEILSAFKCYDADPQAWVAIVSGKGKAFSGGGDVKEPEIFKRLETFFSGVLDVKKPVIAAIHGFCLAPTVVMTLCCDIRIAAEGTRFGWPQAKIGFSSTCGPSALPFVIPRNFACEYLFTGELFTAEEALRFGMVNRVVPPEELMSSAEAMAQKIARNAPLAVQGLKEAMQLGVELPFAQRLRTACQITERTQGTQDAREGKCASKEKRDPIWQGK
jgi:enoyl-CoA hydratase/carnithine racemase